MAYVVDLSVKKVKHIRINLPPEPYYILRQSAEAGFIRVGITTGLSL